MRKDNENTKKNCHESTTQANKKFEQRTSIHSNFTVRLFNVLIKDKNAKPLWLMQISTRGEDLKEPQQSRNVRPGYGWMKQRSEAQIGLGHKKKERKNKKNKKDIKFL